MGNIHPSTQGIRLNQLQRASFALVHRECAPLVLDQHLSVCCLFAANSLQCAKYVLPERKVLTFIPCCAPGLPRCSNQNTFPVEPSRLEPSYVPNSRVNMARWGKAFNHLHLLHVVAECLIHSYYFNQGQLHLGLAVETCNPTVVLQGLESDQHIVLFALLTWQRESIVG